MTDRSSPAVLAIGAAANADALLAVLLLLVVVDQEPLEAVGLSLRPKDLLFSLAAAAATFVLAAGFVRVRGREPSENPAPAPPRPGRASSSGLAGWSPSAADAAAATTRRPSPARLAAFTCRNHRFTGAWL
jgi:hypothetical protein